MSVGNEPRSVTDMSSSRRHWSTSLRLPGVERELESLRDTATLDARGSGTKRGRSRHPNKPPSSSSSAGAVLVVGGSDGSGTRAVADLLAKLGVPMLVDDPGTLDVDARSVQSEEGEPGWPPLVRSALEATHTANFELDDLPSAVRIRVQAQVNELCASYRHRAARLVSEIDAKSRPRTYRVLFGFKAPVSMLLLPFLERALGPVKFLHVLRDGRDVALSDNQSPVRKFYNSFYLNGAHQILQGRKNGTASALSRDQDNSGSEAYLKAMRLWSDWNSQVHERSRSRAANDRGEHSFQYLAVRSEDLLDPRLRLETIREVAAFVGSPRLSSQNELCCLAHQHVADLGASSTDAVANAPSAMHFVRRKAPRPSRGRARMPSADREGADDHDAREGRVKSSGAGSYSNLESLYESWKDTPGFQEQKALALEKAQAVLVEMQNIQRRRREQLLEQDGDGPGWQHASSQEEELHGAHSGEKGGEKADVRHRYGKWVEQLQGQPELLERLQTVGAQTLNLFGYEPPRGTLLHGTPISARTGPMSCDMATVTCDTRNELAKRIS